MSDFSVSVIIPLYNKAPFIRQTLKSVFAQTLTPNEIIIVDDGSTDGGPEAIADLIPGRVRLVSQPNAGPGPARNRGIAEASSEWIALIDGDDRWSPNHLETLAEVVAAHPEVAVVAARHERLTASPLLPAMDTADHATRRYDYIEVATGEEELHTSATAVTRRALLDSGGFGAFMPGEDTELWFRLALDYSMARSTRRTSFYTQETGGIIESGLHRDLSDEGDSPIVTTIKRALANPSYALRHSAIRAFHRFRMVNAIKQELYHSNVLLARRIIGSCALIDAKVPLTYRLLSRLPAPLLKKSVRAAARLRNRLASPLR